MTLYRVNLRNLVVAALKSANTIAQDQIYSPGDWPTNRGNMPTILVTTPRERKESGARAQPNFTTTASILIDARVICNTESDAYVALDTVCEQIEQAILTNYDIIKLVQQVSYVETRTGINSENSQHVAQVMMEFGMEFFQSQEDYFAPVDPIPVEQIAVHADLQNIYDPTGGYPGSLFPNSDTRAPRTSGPDGRDEGLIIVNPPQ